MEVSIIIPTKNEEKYLPPLLESIDKQTRKPLEVIVADANSTDKTRKIASKYGAKIVDGGIPSYGRNEGAKKARGDLLIFLDADVKLENNFLENVINEMERKKIDLASVDNVPFYRLNEKGVDSKTIRTIDRILYFGYNLGQRVASIIPEYRIGNTIINPKFATGTCIIVKKNVFEKVGGFNPEMKVFEDTDFVGRAYKYGNFRILNSTHINISTRRFDLNGRGKFPFEMATGGLTYSFRRNKEYSFAKGYF